jgi:hypothetical protein
MYDLANLAYSKVSPNVGRHFIKAEKDQRKTKTKKKEM